MVGVSYGGALALALGYLLGSIPFGLVLTKLAGAGDLRLIGSGNIGATNVLRTGRKGLAAATLALDALKATLAIVLACFLFGPPTALAAAAVGLIIDAHLITGAPAWLKPAKFALSIAREDLHASFPISESSDSLDAGRMFGPCHRAR